MKIIKYRAWDKIVNKMVEIGEMVVGITTTAWITDGGLDHTSRMIVHGESGEFMQFTGLKDRNGKEIYEGDIVKYQTDKANGSEWRKYVVNWVVDEWRIDCEGFGYEHGRMAQLGEIIGNIYENPELLTPTKN